MRLLLDWLVRMAWRKTWLKRDYKKRVENCSRCIQQVQKKKKKKEEGNAAVVEKSREAKARGFKLRYFDKSETAKIQR